MKQFFKVMADLIESIARARAASSLARLGQHDAAKKLYE